MAISTSVGHSYQHYKVTVEGAIATLDPKVLPERIIRLAKNQPHIGGGGQPRNLNV